MGRKTTVLWQQSPRHKGSSRRNRAYRRSVDTIQKDEMKLREGTLRKARPRLLSLKKRRATQENTPLGRPYTFCGSRDQIQSPKNMKQELFH